MDPIKICAQLKINDEEYNQKQVQDYLKEQVSANTELPQQTKIKLETKISYEKKEEFPDSQENLLLALSEDLQNEINQNGHDQNVNLRSRRRNLSHYERPEQVRLVATHFIEYGLNFRKFNQHYPDIDSKFYRNTVEAINNTAINEIQKYLRYECNIQIQKLNRDQKRSIRTQLTKVREWLGKKDMGQLQTLYKFIQRKYEILDVQISIEEALKFYKTILQIVKSPFVDVMEDDIKPDKLDPEANKKISIEERQTQEKTLIFLYIQHKNLTKVSDLLCQKFGYTIKWSKHAVKQKIKFLLKMSLKKLIGSVQAYERSIKLFFSESEECVELLMKSQNSLNLKVFLLGFYIQRTITLIELREYVKNVNRFFIQQYKGHGQYECKKFQETVKIPKLEIKGQQLEQQKITTEDAQTKVEDIKDQDEKPANTQTPIKEEKDAKPLSDENDTKENDQKKIDKQQKQKQKDLILKYEDCVYESEFENQIQTEESEIKLEF